VLVVDVVLFVGMVVSIINDSEGLTVDSFPALSIATAVTAHVPSVSVNKSQVDAVSTSYVHATVVEPCTAVIVTVSPACSPETPTAGVVTDVVLSVDDEPLSDAASRSGSNGRLGEVVSMTTVRGAEAPDALFWLSTRLDVSVQVPSVIGGRSQVVTLGDATNVQETVVAPLVAVIVTVSSSLTPFAPTAGVESFVSSSLVEFPVSEALSRSGLFGAEMALTVILSVDAVALFRTSTTEYET
jgi:hypothetical protein